MAIADNKITESDYVDTEVADLADEPTQSADELKEWFDKLPKIIATKLNSLIDYLSSTAAGDEIGVSVSGLLASTVSGALSELLITKVDSASPVFTGNPSRAEDLDAGAVDNKLATAKWVLSKIAVSGGGDMLAAIYDTGGKYTDIFEYCTPKIYTVVLDKDAWTGTAGAYSQTVSATGIKITTSTVLQEPKTSDSEYFSCGISMSDVTVSGSVTFTADSIPENDLTVTIVEQNCR